MLDEQVLRDSLASGADSADEPALAEVGPPARPGVSQQPLPRTFPTSARRVLSPLQHDPGAWLITTLECCHLA
jgi:hypothetical protein